MGAVIISIAEIQRQGLRAGQRHFYAEIHAHHQLRRLRKTAPAPAAQLYNQNIRLESNAPVFPPARPAVSGRDSGHMGAVAAAISYRRVASGSEDGVDILLGVIAPDKIALRRTPVNPCLVPDSNNPRRAVLVAKIRVENINSLLC